MNDSTDSIAQAPAPEAAADYQPYVPPRPTGPQALMVRLGVTDPLRWLRQGFGDFRAAPRIGLFYCCCFWAMAAVLALRALLLTVEPLARRWLPTIAEPVYGGAGSLYFSAALLMLVMPMPVHGSLLRNGPPIS